MAVTRKDVASAAGVSPALVSYVLNGGPRPVSKAARARILSAIGELGYRPDGVARNLRTGKSHSVGLVIPDVSQPYFAEFTRVMTGAAVEIDYQLLVANAGWEAGEELRQVQALVDRRVDAMVFMSVDPQQEFRSLEALEIPIVVIDRPEVAVRGTAMAVEHLREHGHTRIGLLTAGEMHVVGERRIQGWAEALRQEGAYQPELVASAPPTRAGGYSWGIQRLAEPEPPTALIVEGDAQAVGVVRAAADLSIEVPGGLAVVSAGGTKVAEFAVPRLTAIHSPVPKLARGALALALGQTAGGLHRFTDVEFEFVPRESCGC